MLLPVPWLYSYQLINAFCRFFRVIARTCSIHSGVVPFLRDSSCSFLTFRSGCLTHVPFLRASLYQFLTFCASCLALVPFLQYSLYPFLTCCAGCLALVLFLWNYWSLCYSHITRTSRSVPLDKL